MGTTLTEDLSISLLKNDSPSLHGKIIRLYGTIPEMCSRSYEITKKHQGNTELHFTREAGVSFNPRSARIAVILLEGNKEIEPYQISLAILSSLLELHSTDSLKLITQELGSELKKSFLDVCNRYQEIITEEKEEFYCEDTAAFHVSGNKDKEEKIQDQILISLFIDKMRHVHLAKENKEKLLQNVRKEAEKYLRISEKQYPYYKPFIEHWLKRTNSL